MKLSQSELLALADSIEHGIQSDIFYDADDYDDIEKANVIEDLQVSGDMLVRFIRSLTPEQLASLTSDSVPTTNLKP